MPSPAKTRTGAPSSASSTRPIAGPSSPSSKKSQTTPPLPPIPPEARTSSANALRGSFAHQHAPSPSSPPPPHIRRQQEQQKGKQPARDSREDEGGAGIVGGGEERLSQDEDEFAEERKQSHELSLSRSTRDSLVDNLLFSLDSLNDGEGAPRVRELDFDYEKYSVPKDLPDYGAPIRASQHVRSDTLSSTVSSTYGARTVRGSSFDSSSTIGRRSMGDRPARLQPEASTNMNTQSSVEAPRELPIPAAPAEPTWLSEGPVLSSSPPISPSKGPEASGMDRGNSGTLPRTTSSSSRPAWKRRSVSVDQLFADAGLSLPSMLDRGRPVPSMFSKYESQLSASSAAAAPEPNIANGPRTQQNPDASGPVYVNFAPRNSTLRKTTTQSDLRSAGHHTGLTPSPSIPLDIRNQASDFVRASSIRGTPALAPVPLDVTRGASSSALSSASASKPPPSSTTRERPGFFRRVFGGGGGAARSGPNSPRRADSVETAHNNNSQQQHQTGGLPRATSAAALSTRTESRQGSSYKQDQHQPQQQQQQNSGNAASKGVSYPPVSLAKKPSSFFRRRKKSTSEQIPVPALPSSATTNGDLDFSSQKAVQSPSISSLRRVMDPYLDGAADGDDPQQQQSKSSNSLAVARPDTTHSSTSAEDSDNLDIFHSGYTPPLDATLGFRNPISRSPTVVPKYSLDNTNNYNDNGSPKMKVKVRKASTGGSAGPVQWNSSAVGADRKENVRPDSRRSSGERIIAAHNTDEEGLGIRAFAPTAQERPESKKTERVFLQPSTAEEREVIEAAQPSPLSDSANGTAAVGSARLSPAGAFVSALNTPVTPSSTVYQSATSLSSPNAKSDGGSRKGSAGPNGLPATTVEPADDAAEYRERARKIFNGDEDDVSKFDAASWLGENNVLSMRTRQAYMALFDFSGVNMLAALRMLCGRLVLRGETQQFDRIITALSERWCECNPSNGFKAQDVVHTILYSLILLNTDLHLADISEKMSRSAYVKNTLPTVKRVVADAAPGAFDLTVRPSAPPSRPTLPWSDSSHSITAGSDAAVPPPFSPSFAPSERPSMESERVPSALGKRLSMRPTFPRNDSDNADGPSDEMNALVNLPSTAGSRGWEAEIEGILKAFFMSIKNEPLPLSRPPVPESTERSASAGGAQQPGILKRTGSIISKAPSDATSYRTKGALRSMTMGLQSKYSRSKPKLYPPSTLGSSSRTSFDDGNSFWSPAQSSNFSSKYSFNKTLTSASMQSLGQHNYAGSIRERDLKHSIGFANALSQAIIREEAAAAATNKADADDSESISMAIPAHGLLEDEALALEGAPWAKEGLVKHKHHHESEGKRAKERSWNDCFAVISNGKLTLFAFNSSGSTSKSGTLGRGKTLSSRPSTAAGATGRSRGPAVGGGDWMENAEQLELFVLRQTFASVLPPPGYSKTRPHVWALSLPSGSIHLFQVGTPEIANEFISTANYWSARLSKEPLVGAVSNIEYGWSEEIVAAAIALRENFAAGNGSAAGFRGRASSDMARRTPSVASSAVASPLPPPTPLSINGPVGKSRSANHIRSPSALSGAGSVTGGGGAASSLRGSLDTLGVGSVTGGGSSRSRNLLPGDKVVLSEWHPPSQSMMPSQLMEVDQLRALSNYVALQEEELERHGGVKGVLNFAYTPRTANHNRALANWQRKSDHLTKEIVKFHTYIESLNAAQAAKEDFYRRRGAASAASGPVDGSIERAADAVAGTEGGEQGGAAAPIATQT